MMSFRHAMSAFRTALPTSALAVSRSAACLRSSNAVLCRQGLTQQAGYATLAPAWVSRTAPAKTAMALETRLISTMKRRNTKMNRHKMKKRIKKNAKNTKSSRAGGMK